MICAFERTVVVVAVTFEVEPLEVGTFEVELLEVGTFEVGTT